MSISRRCESSGNETFEVSEAKVWDLQDPSRIDEAIGGLQIAVVHYVALVQIDHALDEVAHEGGDEHVVEPVVHVVQNVVEAPSGAEGSQYAYLPRFYARPNKWYEVFMSKISHL